jgi:cytochrome c biogenesis protein CcmG, thiol:disulfide interchange protein DsbE
MTQTPARARRPAGPRRSRSRAPLILGIAIAAIVVVALVIAVAIGGGDDDTATSGDNGTGSDAATTGTVVASGTPLPQLDDPDNDPAIGMTFPTLTGVNQEGDPMTIEPDGRPKMVLFLAHWCPHCQREVPVVQKWVDDGNLPEGVDLVSVSTAIDPSRPNYPPDAWLAREGWTAPVLVDSDNSAAEAVGLSAYPFFVAVDAEGKVAQRTSGELTTEQLDAFAAEISGP